MLGRLLTIGSAMVCLAGAPAGAFTLEGQPKIAWIYLNAKNDGGWQQTIDEARVKMEKELHTTIPYVENIPDDAAKIKPAAERYIQRGYNIIVGSSFGYSDAFKDLAVQYPKIAFIDVSGIHHGPNLGSVYGRSYESQYLCGMVAGAMSKSGHLGFVAAHPLGLVNWTINAFALGAQAINPKADVHAVFTGAWDDPVKERAAATAVIDQGADVHRPTDRHADHADRRAGARRLRHRPSPRPERVRAQGDFVLVDLGLGPFLRAGNEEDRSRQLDA